MRLTGRLRLELAEICTMSFSRPQGHAPVEPADSLYAATYKLDELLQGARGSLVRAVYFAKQEGDSWTFKANFDYE